MAKIIDGKQYAKDIQQELKNKIQLWIDEGHRAPQLTAVLVGDDPASSTYVRNKMLAAEEIGIASCTKRLPSTTTENELIAIINELNNDKTVDGILVQLPLPEHINERKVIYYFNRKTNKKFIYIMIFIVILSKQFT